MQTVHRQMLWVLVAMVTPPAVMISSKIKRMDNVSEFDDILALKAKSFFWNRGTAFALTINQALWKSILDERTESL